MKQILLINSILIGILLFYSGDSFTKNMWVFYVIHYTSLFSFIIYFLRKNCRKVFVLFSPMLLSFFYLGIFFTLGAYFIPLNYGWYHEVYDEFRKIKKLNYYTIYFFITNIVLLYYWLIITLKGIKSIPEAGEVRWMRFNPILFLGVFLFFLILNYVKPISTLLMGFAYPFKLVTIIYLVLLSIRLPLKMRLLIYMLIILIIFSLHYSSKREIILVLFVFLFIESLYKQILIKFKMKFLWLSIAAILAAIYIILAASIMRGYGGYKLENSWEAFLKVPSYIQQPYFKDAFVENFEVNTVLGNAGVCMNFVEKGKLPLQYGGTYLKVFFMPIPRSLWENKPEGMILKYSYTLNPENRKKGQSLPVVHYAEGFANFYWFGIVVVVFILVVFEKIFWYIITRKSMNILNGKLIFSIYVICILFQYIRGSGFDLFILYCIMPTPLILLISLLPKRKS